VIGDLAALLESRYKPETFIGFRGRVLNVLVEGWWVRCLYQGGLDHVAE